MDGWKWEERIRESDWMASNLTDFFKNILKYKSDFERKKKVKNDGTKMQILNFFLKNLFFQFPLMLS